MSIFACTKVVSLSLGSHDNGLSVHMGRVGLGVFSHGSVVRVQMERLCILSIEYEIHSAMHRVSTVHAWYRYEESLVVDVRGHTLVEKRLAANT